jgi:lysozyme family protein
MSFDRRQAMAATAGLAFSGGLIKAASAQTSPENRSREIQELFSDADRIGLGRPRPAGPASPLDLAELVEDAVARSTTNEDANVLASRAGLLLSELTRDERDGLATEVPTPAAPRQLTPAMSQDYDTLFASAHIRDSDRPELTRAARFITSDRAKQVYKNVETDTKVPWFMVAAIHYREANLNFMGHLHNGDPLLLRTVHVPANRPPAPWPTPGLSLQDLWRTSAKDALRRFPTVDKWTVPSVCFFLEGYNGFGCRDNGINSPYLWNFTQHYTRGGFPRDHFFSKDYVSRQAGLMAVLVAVKAMAPDDVNLSP